MRSPIKYIVYLVLVLLRPEHQKPLSEQNAHPAQALAFARHSQCKGYSHALGHNLGAATTLQVHSSQYASKKVCYVREPHKVVPVTPPSNKRLGGEGSTAFKSV